MTNQEFSDEFDILYNNITSNKIPGLDEYEKSVFLTKAQSEILKEYFNARIDGSNNGFDGSQKRQYDFSKLIRVSTLFDINSYKERITPLEKIDRRSRVFLFPEDYFLSINEIISDDKYQYSVEPLRYDEYQRLILKPYSYPVKRAAWRLLSDKKNCNYVHEYALDINGNKTTVDYTILSTWADQKRNLKVTFNFSKVSSIEDPVGLYGSTGVVLGGLVAETVTNKIKVVFTDSGWENELLYNIVIDVSSPSNLDDQEVFLAVRDACLYYIDNGGSLQADNTIAKAAMHLDCMKLAEAPSRFTNFKNGGKTFTSEVIQLPYAEVIGRFSGDINYQLRYVKRPSPIILRDLEGVAIEGRTEETPCELPAQIHPEILERAVSIAKLAYQGGTTETLAGLKANINQNNGEQ